VSRAKPNKAERQRIAEVKRALEAPDIHFTVETPLIAAIRAGQLITPEEWNLLDLEKMEEILKLRAEPAADGPTPAEPESNASPGQL
jgi:hypothetical protein